MYKNKTIKIIKHKLNFLMLNKIEKFIIVKYKREIFIFN